MDKKDFFKGKRILLIGGTGTVGTRITHELLKYDPKVIRILSRDEYKQFELTNDLKEHGKRLRFLIGDVRDLHRIERAAENIDVIFHLAAMKHVPSCEYNPIEAVKTNVIGTQNVIEAAIKNNVEKVVFTSTDKAISPTNAMGATKLLAERLIAAAKGMRGARATRFTTVRFGNVMGSRGSVVPLFVNQILKEKKITVTEPDMTRFMMSLSEAANLTLEAAVIGKGEEIFVLKMPVLRTGDLAEVVVEETCKKYAIPPEQVKIEIMGLRLGEKMYEELMTDEESDSSVEFPEMYAILGDNTQQYNEYADIEISNTCSYKSNLVKPLSKEEIRQMILSEGLV